MGISWAIASGTGSEIGSQAQLEARTALKLAYRQAGDRGFEPLHEKIGSVLEDKVPS